MGYNWAKELIHVPFGFILKEGKKMSTRKGKVVLLEKVIEEAIVLAKQNIAVKNPTLPNKDEVAQQVAVGSIIFQDLKNERLNNIEFSIEEMLKVEGETGPYIQYTYARACSILRKVAQPTHFVFSEGANEYNWLLIKELMIFPKIIERSFEKYEPSHIAKYLIDVSQEFNKYYSQVKILIEDKEKESRLALVESTTIVLEEGLRLLGIQTPREM